MIDTIAFSGTLQNSHFEVDMSKHYVYRFRGGRESVAITEQQKGQHYFCRYVPDYDRFTVELNLHKILFGTNCFNYALSPGIIEQLATYAGEAFFLPGTYYVKRIDIGGVKIYNTHQDARNNLEAYRNARGDGFSVKAATAQNYAESVFYKKKDWSIKIYMKGLEQGYKISDNSEIYPGIILNNMLRFEKTYRPGEFKRLGLRTIPWHGVPIKEFSASPVLADFYARFTNWHFTSVPYVADGTGLRYLLQVADQNGNLKHIESMGKVSRSTIYRYRKHKQASAASRIAAGEVDPLIFKENLPDALRNRLTYLLSSKQALHNAILLPKASKYAFMRN